MSETITLGKIVKQARKRKKYTQRELAKIIGIDFTYLSKIENDRVDYPPKEEVIKSFAQELELNSEELIFLSGKIPAQDRELLKQHYKTLPALFRRIKNDTKITE